jgi:MFS family permease
MGLNEAAGCAAVAGAALATGYIAESHGLRPEPFLLGIAFAAVGLELSSLGVSKTAGTPASKRPATWRARTASTTTFRRMGRRAAHHRNTLRPVGPEVAHRRRHVAPSRGLALIALADTFSFRAAAAVLLGAGTAMVYPTLLASIGDVAHPAWRARWVGVYRLWRDGGFAGLVQPG